MHFNYWPIGVRICPRALEGQTVTDYGIHNYVLLLALCIRTPRWSVI